MVYVPTCRSSRFQNRNWRLKLRLCLFWNWDDFAVPLCSDVWNREGRFFEVCSFGRHLSGILDFEGGWLKMSSYLFTGNYNFGLRLCHFSEMCVKCLLSVKIQFQFRVSISDFSLRLRLQPPEDTKRPQNCRHKRMTSNSRRSVWFAARLSVSISGFDFRTEIECFKVQCQSSASL